MIISIFGQPLFKLMTTHDFLSKVKELDLLGSKEIKVKKHWEHKAPSLHPIGSANFMENDLVFHVSDYGEVKLDKIIEDLEESNEGMLRVGSFQIHYIQPTFNGFNLVIHNKTKKVSILKWILGFLF